MKSPGREEENPGLQVFGEEQLGRNIFVLAIPISAGFVTYFNPVSIPLYGQMIIVAISIGSTAIWNGILLRRVCPRVVGAVEVAGVVLMMLGFFSYLGSHLPESFLWLPLLCFFLCLIPIGVGAAIFFRAKNEPPGNGDVPQDKELNIV